MWRQCGKKNGGINAHDNRLESGYVRAMSFPEAHAKKVGRRLLVAQFKISM